MQDIGLELHEEAVTRSAAVGLDKGNPVAGVPLHRVEEILGLVCYRFEGGADEMRPRGSPRYSNYRPADVGIPIRRAESDESWNEEDLARVIDGTRQRLAFRGIG